MKAPFLVDPKIPKCSILRLFAKANAKLAEAKVRPDEMSGLGCTVGRLNEVRVETRAALSGRQFAYQQTSGYLTEIH